VDLVVMRPSIISVTASLLSAAALLGCTNETAGPAPWQPVTVSIVGTEQISLQRESARTAFSPRGDRAVQKTDDGVCLVPLGTDSFDPSCLTDWESFDVGRVAWSSDGTMAAVTPTLTTVDPDIAVLDDDRADVVTDEGVDGLGDDGALFDESPFFGPGDDLYFVRRAHLDEAGSMMRLDLRDSTPTAEPINGLDLDGKPGQLSGIVRLSEHRYAVTILPDSRTEPGRLAVLDLRSTSVDYYELETLSFPIDANDTTILMYDSVAAARQPNERYALFTPATGRAVPIVLDTDERVHGAGFGPDEDFVALLMYDKETNGSRVVGIDPAQPVERPVELIELDPVGLDGTPTGVGVMTELVWSDDGRLLVVEEPDQLTIIETRQVN
jgi:hypothetical protein